ncbi:hypothetical protein HMPREF1316_0551 [Olsenella profusa F0195]|uniref:Uncharacterized protein n=1 Tax=Olsenella profusa F0195 TaxID=1125712 RepID=U2TK26_9ACTN|nr:hypothetical protein HMPREF1316_0551 [Olsenella profusa F0195]
MHANPPRRRGTLHDRVPAWDPPRPGAGEGPTPKRSSAMRQTRR